jgi:hypothetical protein
MSEETKLSLFNLCHRSCVALIYWLCLFYKGETMEEPHNFHMVPQLFLGECSPCVVALKFTKKVNFVGTSLGKKGD